MSDLKYLLLEDDFYPVNKRLTSTLGSEAAMFLTFLIEIESLYADKYGWFYLTVDKVVEALGITRYTQEQIIKELEEKKFIKKLIFGFPSKRCFKLNHEKIEKVLIGEVEL